MSITKYLILTSLLALTLIGCLSTEPESPSISTPRGEWSMRLVAEDNSSSIDYLYLDSATGRISLECRYWARNGDCTDGRQYFHDATGAFTYFIELLDGKTTSILPVPNFQYAKDGKLITRQQFEEGTTKVTFTDRFEYDSAGRLTRVRQYADFITGDLVKTWTFAYGQNGRLDSASILDETHQVLTGVRYSYDASGRLVQVMNSIGYGYKLDRDTQGRITQLERIHPDVTKPLALRVEYRTPTGTFEPDPLKDFFMPDPFSVYP